MKLRLTDTIVVVTSDKIVIRGWRSFTEANSWLDSWLEDQSYRRSRTGFVATIREIERGRDGRDTDV